jgi:lipopolysaccharide/colanic/teichoic acid biosynthesis glycosyltransferase
MIPKVDISVAETSLLDSQCKHTSLYKKYSIYAITKRALDVVLGSMLLTISAPIIISAAVAVRLESAGNPFFVQTRIGLRGRPFKLYKLRGMYIDAPERFSALYNYNKHGNLNFYFHFKDDPRITKVGAIIRRFSIDELPNFLNVVKGDISLVGPRPEIPELFAQYGEYATQYLSVKPGITCLSKISGRDCLTKEESIKMDINYINNQSLREDIKILWITFQRVVLRLDIHV